MLLLSWKGHFESTEKVLAPGQQDTLVESCLMFCVHLKRGAWRQGGSAVPVFRDCRSKREPELYNAEKKNKALNDTEERITMSAVPQCYVILP